MQVRKETILNVFPGEDDAHRLVVAVEQSGDEPSILVLRQETHADDVGWFVQSRIAVEPGQVAGLKMALSGPSAQPSFGARPSPGTRSSRASRRDVHQVPAILRFDGAVAHQAG